MKVAKASLETHKLNLDFCKVLSPIDGRVGRHILTPGNLVKEDQTVLTTVVSLDPIFACFDVNEPTALRVRRAVGEGRRNPPAARTSSHPHGTRGRGRLRPPGVVDFVDNRVNPTTGTLLVRGVFGNPLPPDGPAC